MKIKFIYLIILMVLLFSIFSYYNSFEKVEGNLQDSLLESPDSPDTNIKIIAIDDESLADLGQWPWPRYFYADLINMLSKGNPAVIGIDVLFSEETNNPEYDKAFAEAMKSFGRVVLPVYGEFDTYTRLDNMEAVNLYEPISILKSNSVLGHINGFADGSESISFGFDGDGIMRKGLLYFTYNERQINSFDWAVYSEYIKQTQGYYPEMDVPLLGGNRFYIDYVGGPGQYEAIPFHLVLDGSIPPEYFEDAIVLIGPYTVGIAKDTYMTPLDHQQPMYGVEVHANAIQTLLYKNYRQEVHPVINIIILIFLGILGYCIHKRLKPLHSALLMIVSCIAYISIAKLIFSRGFILQLIYPVVLTVLTYLLTLIYKYIQEQIERRRITDVFGKYVAPQVVEQILIKGEEGLKLGGSRKEISVLFVDIRGFTPLSEKVEPEEVVEILNEYLNLCAQSIFDYDGTLDKFIGDATMAIFNAPLDLEDHAFKAVQAALSMKNGSETLQKKLEEKFGKSVQFGIGINTGHAIIGNIGAKFRMDYTAIGDTVNTAARLESNAEPGQIIISQSTYEMVKDKIHATPLGEIKVKGKEKGISAYQVDEIKNNVEKGV